MTDLNEKSFESAINQMRATGRCAWLRPTYAIHPTVESAAVASIALLAIRIFEKEEKGD